MMMIFITLFKISKWLTFNWRPVITNQKKIYFKSFVFHLIFFYWIISDAVCWPDGWGCHNFYFLLNSKNTHQSKSWGAKYKLQKQILLKCSNFNKICTKQIFYMYEIIYLICNLTSMMQILCKIWLMWMSFFVVFAK